MSSEDEKGRVVVVDFRGERGRGDAGFEELRRGGDGVGGMESVSEISSTGSGVVERRGGAGIRAVLDEVAGRLLGAGAFVAAFRGRPRGFLGQGF